MTRRDTGHSRQPGLLEYRATRITDRDTASAVGRHDVGPAVVVEITDRRVDRSGTDRKVHGGAEVGATCAGRTAIVDTSRTKI